MAKELLNHYHYLIEIKCNILPEWEIKYIPSFTTNKKMGYLLKTITDVKNFIKEIFMIWRYKFHTSEFQQIRDANMEYMKEVITKIENFGMFPYLNFVVNSGINSSINCNFTIFQMREEFINLFELSPEYKELSPEYTELSPEYKITYECSHLVIPYVVFKDKYPNRLEFCIIQNPKYLVSGINQTMLMLRKIYNFDFYNENLQKIGLSIKDKEKFIDLISQKKSFILTKEDFISEKEIYYTNVHFLVKNK